MQGQDTGLQLRGTEGLVSPVDVRTGDARYNLGGSPLIHANVVISGMADENDWIGVETVSIDSAMGMNSR